MNACTSLQPFPFENCGRAHGNTASASRNRRADSPIPNGRCRAPTPHACNTTTYVLTAIVTAPVVYSYCKYNTVLSAKAILRSTYICLAATIASGRVPGTYYWQMLPPAETEGQNAVNMPFVDTQHVISTLPSGKTISPPSLRYVLASRLSSSCCSP